MRHGSVERRRRWAAALAGGIIVLGGASGRAAAQRAPASGRGDGGPIARTFELRARPGFGEQLDDGYRRHIDWHAQAGDRWAWYLWEVTNGERAGLYVDGTFGHVWADFDAAVDPSGDGANNDLNVEPFAVRGANAAWRLRSDLGSAAGAALDPERAPFVLHLEYRVRPGAGAAFAAALRALRAAAGDAPYAVYELVSGGELPTYAIWIPVATWAEAGRIADRTASAALELTDASTWGRAELWRFRPDMSLCRASATHCRATLRGATASGGQP